MPIISRLPQGGTNINGIIRNYYAYAGENISAGDFVEFVSGVAGVGAGAAEEKVLFSHKINNFYTVACVLDENKVLVLYGSDTSVTTAIISIDGVEFTATDGTAISCNSNADIKLVALSSSKVVAIYTYRSSVYARVITINKNTATIGTGQSIHYAMDRNFYMLGENTISKVDDEHFAFFTTNTIDGRTYYYIGTATVTNTDTVTCTLSFVTDRYGDKTSGGSENILATINEAGTRAYLIFDSGYISMRIYIYTLSGGTATKVIEEGISVNSPKTICAVGDDKLLVISPYGIKGFKVNLDTLTITPSSYISLNDDVLTSYNCTEIGENKILMFRRIYTDDILRTRVITLDSDANPTLHTEVARNSQLTMQRLHLTGGKILLIGKGKPDYLSTYGMIYNAPNTTIEYYNYTYETQVRKSTTNKNINGVALDSIVGGTNIGALASHNQNGNIISKL